MARRILGSQLVTMSGTDHLSYAEQPAAFNAAVLRFLDSFDSAGGKRSS